MDNKDALLLIISTLNQWVEAIKAGVNTEEYKALLLSDLQSAKNAANVISEWLH